jgi:hypothetical protein
VTTCEKCKLALLLSPLCGSETVEGMYVVASTISRNHIGSKKYKTVQSFKLYLLKNNPPVQIYIAASESKVLEMFLEVVCESLFSSSIAFLMMSFASQKRLPSVLISVQGTCKYHLEPVGRVWGMLQCCRIVLC